MLNRTGVARVLQAVLAFWAAVFPSLSCASMAPIRVEMVTPPTENMFPQTSAPQLTPSQLQLTWTQMESPQVESHMQLVALPLAAPAIGIPVLTMSGPPGWVVLTVAVAGGVIAVIYMSAGGQDEIDKLWGAILQQTAEMEAAQAAADAAYAAGDALQGMLWEEYAYSLSQSIADLMNLVEVLEGDAGPGDDYLPYGP